MSSPRPESLLKCVDYNAYEAVKTASLTFVNFQQSDDKKTTEIIEPKHSKLSPEWVYKNQVQKVRSIPLSFDVWFKQYGEGRVSISWYDLQTTLRQLLPEDQVKPNHHCINVVDEPEKRAVDNKRFINKTLALIVKCPCGRNAPPPTPRLGGWELGDGILMVGSGNSLLDNGRYGG